MEGVAVGWGTEYHQETGQRLHREVRKSVSAILEIPNEGLGHATG